MKIIYKHILLLLLIFQLQWLFAQSTFNLVPNGDFETRPASTPFGKGSGSENLPEEVPPWKDVSGTGGEQNAVFDAGLSPPVFPNNACPGADGFSVPINEYGCEDIRATGFRYVGLKLSSFGASSGGIAVKLKENLSSAFTYSLKFYVSLAELSVQNSRIRVRVGNSTDWSKSGPDILDKVVKTKEFTGWDEINLTFDVSSDESYILFRIGCAGICVPLPFNQSERYLYLDDITLFRSLEPKVCALDFFNLKKETIYNTGTFIIKGDLLVDSNVILESGSDIFFQAGNEIEILPEFVAEAGTEFIAQIVPCATTSTISANSNILQNEKISGYSSFENNTEFIIEEAPSTVEETEAINFKAIPNPNSGSFFITSDNNESVTRIEVYNSFGELVFVKTNLNKTSVSINKNCTSGMYFVKVWSGEQSSYVKVMIN